MVERRPFVLPWPECFFVVPRFNGYAFDQIDRATKKANAAASKTRRQDCRLRTTNQHKYGQSCAADRNPQARHATQQKAEVLLVPQGTSVPHLEQVKHTSVMSGAMLAARTFCFFESSSGTFKMPTQQGQTSDTCHRHQHHYPLHRLQDHHQHRHHHHHGIMNHTGRHHAVMVALSPTPSS